MWNTICRQYLVKLKSVITVVIYSLDEIYMYVRKSLPKRRDTKADIVKEESADPINEVILKGAKRPLKLLKLVKSW